MVGCKERREDRFPASLAQRMELLELRSSSPVAYCFVLLGSSHPACKLLENKNETCLLFLLDSFANYLMKNQVICSTEFPMLHFADCISLVCFDMHILPPIFPVVVKLRGFIKLKSNFVGESFNMRILLHSMGLQSQT